MDSNISPFILNIISIVLILLNIVLLISSFKKTDTPTYNSFNAKLKPAEISVLTFGNMYFVKSITSTFIDWNDNKNIKINYFDNDYEIEFLSDDSLVPFEKYLFNLLKSISPKLTSKQLLKASKDAPDDFNLDIQKYFDMIDESLLEKQLNKKNNSKKPVYFILIVLILLIVSLLIVSESMIAILVIPLSLILAFNETKKIFSKTPQGDKLQRFYLHEVDKINSVNVKNEQILISFNEMVALGIKNEKLEKYCPFNFDEFEILFKKNNLIFANKKSR